MPPDIWGRHLWMSIHFIALGYPMEPTDENQATYRDFYNDLWKVVPCYKCANNYKLHLEELPVEGFLGNKDLLFEWTVRLHNIVNRDLGKPLMSLHDAQKLYRGYLTQTSSGNPSGSTVAIYVLLVVVIASLSWYLVTKHLKK